MTHESVGGASLWGAAAGPTSVVAVGTGGKIMYSTDGIQWTDQNSGTTEWLLGAAYGAGKFIVVGDHGTLLESTDGKSWTSKAAPTQMRLNNIAFANGQFVAVGEAGTLLVSSGNGWQAVSSGVSGWLRGLAHGRELWVATGQGGTFLWSRDALTWFSADAKTIADLEAVTYTETTSDYEGGTSSLGLPPNALPRFGSFDWFGICGANGSWSKGQSRLAEAPVIRNLDTVGKPVFYSAPQSSTTSRLRAAVSVAGVTVLAGEGGVVVQQRHSSAITLIRTTKRPSANLLAGTCRWSTALRCVVVLVIRIVRRKSLKSFLPISRASSAR